tara:strand:- start:265 stop:1347 length:1083 start_codon:yes stop_codon:yes gene_type:complete
MTEIQEMAQAIHEKHKALWPLTWAVADFMAKQLAGDQGYLIVNQLTHELMGLNTEPVEPAPEPRDKRVRPSYLDQAVIDRVAESSARHLEEIGRGLAEPAPAQDEALADRMRAAGMMTIDEMLSGAPLDRFMRHAGVHDLATYGQWLDMKCREFLTMQAKRDLNKDPEDAMYEWVIAHAAVFQEARINFNAARPAQTERQPSVRITLVENDPHGGTYIRQWDNLAGLGAGLRLLYAAPIAQTAPQFTSADESAVRELLAVLNRDGGQHQDSVGLAQAAQDALGEVDRLRQAQTEQQPEQSGLYTCIGKGGSYELIGRATTAGALKVTGRFADEVIVYRDTESSALYCREPGDFRLRMARC